jgi:hypothetical protein
MKQFLKKISFYGVLVLVMLCVLDLVYTQVYKKSNPRNKIQYALALQNESFDYIFLGSSRVENTIVTSEIVKATNKKAINLGFQQVKLKDILLFLKILVNNNVKADKLFIQIDYNYNILVGSEIIQSQTLPYIRSNTFINNYLKETDSSFFSNYYIPFYRYAVNDYKIGFREFFSSAIGKKVVTDLQDGYRPLYGKMQPDKISILPEKLLENNPTFNEIKQICKANNIKVVFFCAPFCKNVVENEYLVNLNKRIPELYDFSKVITEPEYYIDCSHLNNDGALKFTSFLIDKFKL